MAIRAIKPKLDSEARNFNDECRLKYSTYLPTLPNSKPMCLLWNKCVLAVKKYNLNFTTKHGDFGISYPDGSVARKSKVELCYI